MRQYELHYYIDKKVMLNGRRDLGIDPDLKKIIGTEVTIIKQCKNGLIQIESNGDLYSVPLHNLDSIGIQ